MLLGLRSLLPLSLSGALALIGLWWYTSRKKACLKAAATDGGEEEADGDGRLVQKGSTAEQADLDAAAAPPPSSTASSESADGDDPFPGTAAETTARAEPGTGDASPRENPLSSSEGPASSCDPGVEPQPPDVQLGVAATKEHAELERADPEGEVGGGEISEHHRPRSEPTEKEICPVPSAAGEPACGSGPTDPLNPPGVAATPASPGPASSDEMRQLAEGLISDVVTAAQAEVLRGRATEKSLPEQGESPLCAREPCGAAAPAETHGDSPQRWKREDEGSTANRGSGTAGTPSVLQEDRGAPETPQPGMRPELVERHLDSSSTSSCQTEDSSSDEDYRVPPRPGPEDCEDVDKVCGSTGGESEVLSNGHKTEEKQLTQGHGVTSITSYCEQGAADGQFSSIQPSLSSQPPAQSAEGVSPPQTTETQTVWEIEVPKHLVGRMIGKQGRYLSYLETSSGAKVFISTVPYTQAVQICHIEGTKDQVEVALDLIRMKFKDLELTNCHVQPPAISLPALPITSWLVMPPRVTVEVKVVQVASGNYLFLQQHTHPTFCALPVLDQQMRLCYSHPGCPCLPAPVEVGVICAAQLPEGVWWRAQVMRYDQETREVEIRYVDYGGYHTVNIDNLRQIRSDFVSLPFQGSEVILENLAPLSGEEDFSAAAKSALEDLTRGVSLLAQVTEFHTSGIPLVQIWRKENELVSVNQALVNMGVCSWINRP